MFVRRSWFLYVGLTAAAALAALLYLKSSPTWPTDHFRAFGQLLMLLCAPGLIVDYLVGAANAGPVVYLLNLGVVAVVSGLFWGTLLFWAGRLLGRPRRSASQP